VGRVRRLVLRGVIKGGKEGEKGRGLVCIGNVIPLLLSSSRCALMNNGVSRYVIKF